MSFFFLNEKKIELNNQKTIFEICKQEKIKIPSFCYHQKLSIAGNCRMCLVEIKGTPKLLPSCQTYVLENMEIYTKSKKVEEARQSVLELLLINHPLDCPVCDLGGECDLQNYSYEYGSCNSYYKNFPKRIVSNKNLSPFIKTEMTRCIHCTKCTRFMDEIAGTGELKAFNRGEYTEIDVYKNTILSSPLSGNIIDICPVGALNDKLYSFKARSWEMSSVKTIDIFDAFCSAIYIDHRDNEIMRIRPCFDEHSNEEWITDRCRFSHDGYKKQRLLNAYQKQDETLTQISFQSAFKKVCEKITHAKAPLFLIGPLTDNETLKSLKIFCEHIGSHSYESQFKTPHEIRKKTNRPFYMHTPLKKIDDADCIWIQDLDLFYDAPLVFSKIWGKYQKENIQIFSTKKQNKAPYSYTIFDDFEKAVEIFNRSNKPLLLCSSQSLPPNYSFQRDEWNGKNIIPEHASSVEAINLGLTMPYPIDLNLYDLIYLIGVDENIDFDLLKNKDVIYQGTHFENGAQYANLIIPNLLPIEKNCTYKNINNMNVKSHKAIDNKHNLLSDNQIFDKLLTTLPKMKKENPIGTIDNLSKDINYSFYHNNVVSRSSVMIAKFLTQT